jgi:hypothetical protein
VTFIALVPAAFVSEICLSRVILAVDVDELILIFE